MLDTAFDSYWTVAQNSFAYDESKTDKDGSTKITVVVPGLAKEDLSLSISDGRLTLSSKQKERPLTRFWNLSDSVDTKNITADCKNGILTISVPLKPKTDKSRTIEIK